MEKYNLTFRKSVAHDLQAIPRKDIIHILRCFDELRKNPRSPGCEKLSSQERYRMRAGVYRIIYEICDNTAVVVVVKVGHRREVYKKR